MPLIRKGAGAQGGRRGSVMHTRTSLFHKYTEQGKGSNMDTFLSKINTVLSQNSPTTMPTFTKSRKLVPPGIDKILKTVAKFFQVEELTWTLQYQYQDFAGLFPKVE